MRGMTMRIHRTVLAAVAAAALLTACGQTTEELATPGQPGSTSVTTDTSDTGGSTEGKPRKKKQRNRGTTANDSGGGHVGANPKPPAKPSTVPHKIATAPPPSGPPTFGRVSVRGGDSLTTVDGSRQYMSVDFSELEVHAGPNTQLRKRFRARIGLSGDTRRARLEVYVSGFVLVAQGADARLRVTVNGVTRSHSYAPSPEAEDGVEFVEKITIPRVAASSCTVTITLDAGADDGEAYLNVTSIDANIH
jgi:hypothetical protein